MKRFLLYGLLLLMLLFCTFVISCSKAPVGEQDNGETASPAVMKPNETGLTYHEVFDPETDYDNRFGRGYSSIAESEDAYYIIFGGQSQRYVYYSSKSTGEYDLLCGKPECMHDTEYCNAMIMGRAGSLNRVGDRLFYIVPNDARGRGAELSNSNCYSIALDGTDRRLEFEMPCKWENGPQSFYYHRGKFYGSGWANTIVDGEAGMHLSVTCWDPKTGDCELIFERDGCSSYACPRLFCFGRFVYICFDSITGFEKYQGAESTAEVWRWDTETEELEPVYAAEPGSSSGCMYNIWVESEDCIYIAPNLPDPAGPFAVYRIGRGELSEACRFKGSGGGISILDGVLQRHYIHLEEQTFEVELIDFDGKPIYWDSLDMSFISEIVPGAVFTSYYSSYGSRDAVYYVFTAEADDGNEFAYIVEYEFGKPGEEPTRTVLCVDTYE